MVITIRQMEVFSYIAEFGSVSLAANQLMISQSAASMSLAEFERQIGQPLFDRNGKTLVLNNVGRTLLPKVQEILIKINEIGQTVQEDEYAGDIKIGASSTIGNYLMPAIFADFTKEYPKIRFSLSVGNTEEIVKDILDYNIDIGFIEGLCCTPGIDIRKWRDDRLAVFASRENKLAKKKTVTIKDLVSAKWILRESGSGTRTIFENALAGKIDTLDVKIEIGHSEAIKLAVKKNLGISCLSIITLEESFETGSVVEIPTPFLNLKRSLFILTRKAKYLSPSMKIFESFVCDKY